MQPSAINKKKILLETMLQTGMVTVVVDTTKEGVEVPEELMGDIRLRLNLSWKFRMPMELTDEAIHAALTFSGKPFACVIPWKAIWMAKVGDEGYVFPESFPHIESMFSVPKETVVERPKLVTINGDGETTEPRTGHLRLLH